jgi:hypothetical protein
MNSRSQSYEVALAQLKRRRKRCKEHPEVPLINHVRRRELAPIGEKAHGFKGGPSYY